MARPLVGVFKIRVSKAKELEDVQTIGKQDPYVVIEGPQGQKYKTKWHEDGGRTPTWDEDIHVYFPSHGEAKDRVVKLSVWDKNLVSDDVVAYINFNAGDLLSFNGKGPQWHGMTTPKGKYAGSVFLDVTFVPGIGITVNEGKDLRDVQRIGKQDPYVEIILGEQKVKTKESPDGGTKPKWSGETHFFANNPNLDPAEEKQNAFFFEVRDSNVMSDKTIGAFNIPYSFVAAAAGKGAQWYPVYKGKKEKEAAGEISLTVEKYTLPK